MVKTDDGMLSRLQPKQKVIIGILIVVVLVILWQVKGLFEGGGAKPSAPPRVVATTAPASASATHPVSTTPPSALPVQQSLMDNQQLLAQQAILMKQQQAVQAKYLNALNELQMLKIQQEIAQANQAIATARLAAVTAEKGISDLLTKPTAPSVPSSVYASNLVTPTQTGEPITPSPPSTPPPAAPTIAMDVPYVVISVSMESHKWNAVIGYQGKLYTVSIGDALPIDGSIIKSISRNGVVLNKEGKTRTIGIVSSI